MQLDLNLVSQRHNKGRASYNPSTAPIDTSRYAVERIQNEAEAKPFVLGHHYSASFPAAIASFGLFHTTPGQHSTLVGVAVFSVPMNVAGDIKRILDPGEAACELGRFVLLDSVPRNGETWMLRRALSGLQAEKTISTERHGRIAKYPVCVSFSDPVGRSTRDGQIAFRGHYGHIYGWAFGSRYVGRGSSKEMWLADDGTALVSRTLNKLRNGESGDTHVYEQLRRLGAPKINGGESGKHYVERALSGGAFRKVRHAGNHRYIFTMGTASRRRALTRQLPKSLPYPTRTD